MMRIPNPRESTGNADGDRYVGNDSSYENRVVIVLVVDEDEGHPEDKPHETCCRTARMNAANVL